MLVLTGNPYVAVGQEGHPLTGTWMGNWGESDTFMTLILSWDGENIRGLVNPGPMSSDLQSGSLDSSDWVVELAMPLLDDVGNSGLFSLSGHLENIGSRVRVISGTYRYQGETGSIQLIRQRGG